MLEVRAAGGALAEAEQAAEETKGKDRKRKRERGEEGES